MSLTGEMMEKKCEKALDHYFNKLAVAITVSGLSNLAGAHTVLAGRHASDATMKNVLRRQSTWLREAIASHYAEAMRHADKQAAFHEAAKKKNDIDDVGLSAQEAADYAEEYAGKKVKDIDKTTMEAVSDAVANAIEEQLGPAGLARELRELTDSFSGFRARAIARTEMADAYAEASVRKLARLEVEYKQLITSPDACDICIDIEDQGPVPLDEPFVDSDGEEYDRSPIHVNCRCATVGARAPEEN
jgi:hypothetical protein